MKIKFEWVRIFKTGSKDEQIMTERAKVGGGWIVKNIYNKQLKHTMKRTESLVYVPDVDHSWEIE